MKGLFAKTDAEAVRAHNRRVVIDHLRRADSSTRRATAQATGLSVSSASAIATDLIRSGIFEEVEEDGRSARRGRPEKTLRVAGSAATVAAAKLAVGGLFVQLADYAGRPLATAAAERPVADLDASEIASILASLTEEAASGLSGETPKPSRMVVAVQGMTDAGHRRILWSPALKRRDLDIAGMIQALTGTEVEICNDCSLMPEAFRWRPDRGGLDLGTGDFATLFIGFGVGMGLRLGGQTFGGPLSSAVEFGHLNHRPDGALCRCGNRGCVEAYAGDYAIQRRALGGPVDAVPARRVTDAEMRVLAGAARERDGPERDAFAQAGLAIGYGLGRLFTLIDPLPIVFTGSGAHAMDLLEPAIRRGITQSAVAGQGAAVPFGHVADVDALVFEAGTAHALASLDESFAREGPADERQVA
ncbi:ROK family protein [Antarcticirhabdus aurantiaca]|uniref:ROK family protein n=1 Tax=Antarcticirhabdus aurantiaca TaxID=2606717 RepID=A0ACD4NSK1_9HYPH|nr:ROK family protein [Antarcticirhabdus aurantiaca]WAJ29767.1 ROK family protein [Jeongeuplla avenae]